MPTRQRRTFETFCESLLQTYCDSMAAFTSLLWGETIAAAAAAAARHQMRLVCVLL